ncbi:MAG: QueT transporter family protein [Clostridia bacterium]|nr:QueT transporter family protein [Clostridia bacterium]
MSKSYRHTIVYITKAAAIAALYVVLTELSAQFGLSGTNVIQFRISEALTILPFFTSAAIPGLVIGCFFSNLLTGAVVWDIVFGTLATLIGAILTYALRRYKWLAPIPPILANTLIVPFVLRYAYGFADAWWYLALTVFVGEFVCCGILGMLLLFALNRQAGFLADRQEPMQTERCSFKERFPRYMWVTFLYLVAIDLLTFYATRPILPYLPAHSLSTPLDELIPLRPEWVTIYFLSFLSWLITLIWMLAESKQHAYRLAGVYTIIMIVCLICFLGYPVTIRRPEITESGFFNDWMRFLYAVDSPTNLCPSLHVVISYICWRGVMGCKKIPKWYQWFNLFFLILVCFSILHVKQHFVADIGAAVVVTEGALQIGRVTRIERIGFAIENRLNRRKAA